MTLIKIPTDVPIILQFSMSKKNHYKRISKFFLIVILLLLSISPLVFSKNVMDDIISSQSYYCPPCGCKHDELRLSASTNCTACGMKLIEVKHGLTGETANALSGFFRQNALNGTYYDRIMYPAFFAGILLSIVMVTKAKKNQANFFLSMLTLSFSLYPLQNRMGSLSHILTDSPALLFLPISFIAVIGPSVYFYTKTYVGQTERNKKDYLHFAPALLFFLMHLFLFLKSDTEKDAIYLSPDIIAFFNYEQLVAIILIFIYTYLSFKIINKHKTFLNGTTNGIDRKLNWLKKFNLILALFILGWFGILMLNKFLFSFGMSPLTYYPVWGAIALFIYWIGFHCLFRSNLIFANGNGKLNDYNDALTETQVYKYKTALIDLMNAKKPYLNSSLDLNKLSELMRIKSKHLTIVLNRGLNKNFYDFLNEFRIKEAKKKLVDPENKHLTILAIAYDSGFNSKSTFNAVFKNSVKMTPKEFQKKLLPSAS